MRVLLENVRPIALGHAADDADDEVGLGGFAVAELAEAGPDFLFGVFADGAGVVKDDIGQIAVIGRLIAVSAKLPQNQLTVEHVHLAAEGFEVESLGGLTGHMNKYSARRKSTHSGVSELDRSTRRAHNSFPF